MVTKPTAYAVLSPRRPHSITVFGCTGNAGRAVAYHCVRSAVLRVQNDDRGATPPLRIALAGRERDRVTKVLDGIRDELRAEGVLLRAVANDDENNHEE